MILGQNTSSVGKAIGNSGFLNYYASLSSGDAYSDRQLTPNFWVEIFCVGHVSVSRFRNPVRPYPEKRNRPASSISVLH